MSEELTQPHLYEERHSYLRQGFDLDMDGTRRLFWRESMAGGMGGFFGFYPATSSAHTEHPYPAPEQLRTHHGFWHGHKRLVLGMAPANELSEGGVVLRDPSSTRYVFYLENASAVPMNLSGMKSNGTAVAVDTKKPYAEVPVGSLLPKEHRWEAPYVSDWAIAVGF